MRSGTWPIGVAICVVASILNTFGINLQKFAHNQETKKPTARRRPYYQNFLWWAGYLLILVGCLADIVALAFAAQSLIAPLAGLTLVFNVFIAPCFLKEKVTGRDWLGTLIIVVGCAIAVAFAMHEDTLYTFEQLVDMTAYEPIFITYFITILGIMGASYMALNRLSGERNDDSAWYHEYKEWHPASIALLAGVAGSQSVTFAKAGAELVKSQIDGAETFQRHYLAAPFCVVMLVIFLLVQLHFLNKGLELFDTLLIFPMYQACWILFTTVSGMVTYQEYSDFDLKCAIGFPIGVAITLGGVFVIAGRKTKYSLLRDEDDACSTRPWEDPTQEHIRSTTAIGEHSGTESPLGDDLARWKGKGAAPRVIGNTGTDL